MEEGEKGEEEVVVAGVVVMEEMGVGEVWKKRRKEKQRRKNGWSGRGYPPAQILFVCVLRVRVDR
jgi:hypothetical protein